MYESMEVNMFKQARRNQSKLRLALIGPSGSGKTYSSLLIAKGLGGSIAMIDTERGSGNLYSDLADYDIAELESPFTPEKYVSAIQEAEKAGYDTIVIGSGSGMLVVENAIAQGLDVALVDAGPAGGTCLNVGCIPSKMLIAVADRVMEIREAEKFGIKASVDTVDFRQVMADMRAAVRPDHEQIHRGLAAEQRLEYYEGIGRFVDDYTLQIDDEVITGEKIFIVSGARPLIPPVPGLEEIDYLTNETLLDLETCPQSLAIIGGGYIAAEYGHFFSAMGADVTIVQRAERLVPTEDSEVSDLLATDLRRRMSVETDAEVKNVSRTENGYALSVTDNRTEHSKTVYAEKVLLAAGRQSNADRLAVENTGVSTDGRGFIETDDYLQTSKENIWAYGDANGKAMFTHAANAEADIAWQNAMHEEKKAFDYRTVPRAVFTYPPIASVGMTESEARQEGDILVGKAQYAAAAKGMAIREQERGFAKVIVNRRDLRILGFHIIGPHAPMLIQEVVNAMALGGQPGLLFSGIHIHPAMSELIAKTFSNLA